MPAINDLLGLGSAVGCPTPIILGPIAADDVHARMLPEPFSKGFRTTVFQQVYWLVRLSIDEDRSVGVPSPKGEIIHPKNAGSWWRPGLLFSSPQKRVGTHWHGSLISQP
jgi:hypothetical protein